MNLLQQLLDSSQRRSKSVIDKDYTSTVYYEVTNIFFLLQEMRIPIDTVCIL